MQAYNSSQMFVGKSTTVNGVQSLTSLHVDW